MLHKVCTEFFQLCDKGKQLASHSLLIASPLNILCLLGVSFSKIASLKKKKSLFKICILDISTLTGKRGEGGSHIPYVPEAFCIKTLGSSA